MQMRAQANREHDGVSGEAPTTVRRGRSRRNLQEQERGVSVGITTARTSAVARKCNDPAVNQEPTSKKRRMRSSASVALETAATTYNAVGGYPTTITSYADRRLSPIVDSDPDVSISDNESSGEEEYDTIEDTNQPLVDEEKNNRKRAEVLATAVDVSICRPEVRVNYDALDSDGPSDDEQDTDPDFEEGIHFVDTSAAWTDAALAGNMVEAGGDMNDDDALLKIAKNRNEIKAWQENGWDLEEKSYASQNEYRGCTRRLFKHIADESNHYAAQTVIPRAQKIKKQQEKNKRSGVRSRDVESTKQIRQRLRAMKTIEAHELAVVIDLSIARMLCPHKRRLSSHWCVSSIGAIPAGTFGSWMPRNKEYLFDDIMHHLHFADNNDPRAKCDRAWKIRPVIDTLQNTFKKGYRPGPILSFDEGMIPSQSKFNDTRTFMRDKPHKWGTKLFLTCCSRTSYCLRLEVYCGKKAHLGGPQTIDDKSGPAAVLRNLNMVLPVNSNAHHTVVIDRFYTPVALALELLAHKIYTVGTIQTQRIGFPSELKDKRKKRPASIPRGTYQVARSKAVPDMTVCRWWDSKPVYMLATGASTQEFTIRRNAWSESEESVVPCPKLVKDYHHNMGGVDVHGQLRLQRYSVQMASTFKKYYKTLFLGLLDLALVNKYVVHRAYYAGVGKRGLSHSEFLTSLQAQLLSVRPQHMTDSESVSTVHSSSPTSVLESRPQRANIPAEHVPVETEDFDKEVGHPDRKRMARECKVCSILAEEGKRGKNTKWLCEACSAKHPGDVYLCQVVRQNSFGTMKSCFAIYHDDWECGKRIPMISDKRIQYRKPNGKRKRLTAQ